MTRRGISTGREENLRKSGGLLQVFLLSCPLERLIPVWEILSLFDEMELKWPSVGYFSDIFLNEHSIHDSDVKKNVA